jgi:hypothetical protein
LILELEPRLNSNEASVLPLQYILIKLENLINISLEHRRKAKGFDAYGNVEKSGLEPENTIRKIVVLPIKLYPRLRSPSRSLAFLKKTVSAAGG